MTWEYHHRKQKGLAELKKAVKRTPGSLIIVNKADNFITAVLPKSKANDPMISRQYPASCFMTYLTN